MSRSSSIAQRPRSGAILLMVLVMVFLASILVVKVIEEITLQVRAQAAQVSRDDLRFTGLSALETSLAVLNEIREIDGSLNGPNQGWRDPIAYAGEMPWPEGIAVEVTITDETGKFALNEATVQTLKSVFDTLDIDPSDAETMTDSLLDWMDEDDSVRLNGAEARFYQNDDIALSPANAPLKSWEALRYINGFRENFFDDDGVPNDLYRRFTDSFSLHTDTSPNLNTATPDVLETLSERYGFETDYLLEYLKGDDGEAGTGDDKVLTSADELPEAGIYTEELPVNYAANILKIEVRVSYGDKAYLLSALVDLDGAEETPANGESGEGELAGDRDARIDTTPGPTESTSGNGGGTINGNAGSYPFTVTRLAESLLID